TIEHGDGMTDSLLDVLVAKGVYWVPTVTVAYYVAGPRSGVWGPMVEHQRRAFTRALKKGVRIVLGTDVGGFPWTELNQAKEFEYYVQYGMTPMQAIKSGTSLAAELLGQRDLGVVAPGAYADLVAVGLGGTVACLPLRPGGAGQNLLGPERGPVLGVIRSEGLLAARRTEGARQFFTRAYDFGYSKTLDDALRLWPRDSVLKDVL